MKDVNITKIRFLFNQQKESIKQPQLVRFIKSTWILTGCFTSILKMKTRDNLNSLTIFLILIKAWYLSMMMSQKMIFSHHHSLVFKDKMKKIGFQRAIISMKIKIKWSWTTQILMNLGDDHEFISLTEIENV